MEDLKQKKRALYALKMDGGWEAADPRCQFNNRYANPSAKIMPASFQANHLRKCNRSLWVLDDFLPQPLFQRLQGMAEIVARRFKGYSQPMDVVEKEGVERLVPSPWFKMESRKFWMPKEEKDQVVGAMSAAMSLVHQQVARITTPGAIINYHGWINTGPIRSGKKRKLLRPEREFHFWHYDSDVMLEFRHQRDWVRFPVWGVILYIHQPEGLLHYTEMDGHTIDQKIVARPNRLVIFDPRYPHRVVGPDTSEQENLRTVLVMNGWDYMIDDYKAEYSNGVYDAE